VLEPLAASHRRTLRYGIGRGWRYAAFCFRYPSQRRTWLGLFPQAFIRRVLVRVEQLNGFDGARLERRPHPGTLLYERMFAIPYERVAEQVSRFFRSRT
jgi:hypothetical protein